MVDLKEILTLSVPERITIIEKIWDSIDQETDAKHLELTKEREEEILRRLDQYEKGKSKTYTWEEVKSRANSKNEFFA
jgi:putative addiction module component (TIGR02574 family)